MNFIYADSQSDHLLSLLLVFDFFFESKYFHENLHLICLTKSITEKLDREKKITDSLDRKETGEQNQTNKPDQTL